MDKEIKKEYTVIAINNILDTSNLIFVNHNGANIVTHVAETVDKEFIKEFLSNKGIKLNDCRLLLMDESVQGKAQVTEATTI